MGIGEVVEIEITLDRVQGVVHHILANRTRTRNVICGAGCVRHFMNVAWGVSSNTLA